MYRWLIQSAGAATLSESPPDLGQDINDAVNGLRHAGEQHLIIIGLLTRAWHRHLTSDTVGVVADLDEAWEISELGPCPSFKRMFC
jgi:hypothetical protein